MFLKFTEHILQNFKISTKICDVIVFAYSKDDLKKIESILDKN
ncbi:MULTISPECIES: hypothetical protein [Campylobacter]|nr:MULTISPECIES: hypothetical protein [Campylobacter]MDD7422347.1 hypothetical protein [Campylobacter hominis]MDY3117536.1 hypothetical protein [Campylobacter hominis]